MEAIDPATGQPLAADAIQRVLFIGRAVHVYNIPPLTSTKGYTAADWTVDPARHIFTARLRLIETATPQPGGEDTVKADVVLEDGSTGQLFAAAPYASADVVEPALDSSRFFALRVRDPSGRRAVLGIGFEERPDAFDFSVALQEVRKTLGLERGMGRVAGSGRPEAAAAAEGPSAAKTEEKRDYSLKEGETITVSFGGSKLGRRNRPAAETSASASGGGGLSSFSLPPPPSGSGARSSSGGGGGGFSLPPPPSGPSTRSPPASSSSARDDKKKSAAELGFDDGQFGEFA